MRKNAPFITLGGPVLGIFALLLRWLQISNIFEEETGLAIAGRPISYVFSIFCILCLIYFFLVAKLSSKRFTLPSCAAEAFKTNTILYSIFLWPLAVILGIAGLIMMFKSTGAQLPALQRIWSALLIFAASALPFVPGKKKTEGQNSLGIYSALCLVIFGCFWVVFSYKANAENPVLWQYCVEILAVCALCLALYSIGGMFFERGKPAAMLFFIQSAQFFLIAAVTGDGSTVIKMIMIIFVFAISIYEHLFILNFAPPKNEDEEI